MPARKSTAYKADEELVKLLKNPPKPLCSLGRIIADHPNGKDIQKAVDNPKWSAASLAQTLGRELKTSLGTKTMTDHRNHRCICYLED